MHALHSSIVSARQLEGRDAWCRMSVKVHMSIAQVDIIPYVFVQQSPTRHEASDMQLVRDKHMLTLDSLYTVFFEMLWPQRTNGTA